MQSTLQRKKEETRKQTPSQQQSPPRQSELRAIDPLLEKIPTNKRKRVRGPKSWEFLLRLLKSPATNPSLIKWEDEELGIFRLIRPEVIAQRWGQRTGKHIHDVLSYESFSRGLRYHYATGALCAVSEKSFVYQFGPKAYKSTASIITPPAVSSAESTSPTEEKTSGTPEEVSENKTGSSDEQKTLSEEQKTVESQ